MDIFESQLFRLVQYETGKLSCILTKTVQTLAEAFLTYEIETKYVIQKFEMLYRWIPSQFPGVDKGLYSGLSGFGKSRVIPSSSLPAHLS